MRLMKKLLAVFLVFSLLLSVSFTAVSAAEISPESKAVADETSDFVFRVTNDLGWDELYAYAWDKDGNTLCGDLPGIKMTETTDSVSGVPVYECAVPYTVKRIMFTDGKSSGNRTVKYSCFNRSYESYKITEQTDAARDYIIEGRYAAGEAPVYDPDSPVFSVVGSSDNIFANAWDAADTSTEMVYDEADGLYKLTLTGADPGESTFLVIKNHSFSEMDLSTNLKLDVSILQQCDLLITYDPKTYEMNVIGDYVEYSIPQYDYQVVWSVIAAGNGDEISSYLNGASWDLTDESNELQEVSDGVFEFTYNNVAARNYQVIFALNPSEEDPWKSTFGAESDDFYLTNVENKIVQSKKPINFQVAENRSTVKFILNLRNFDAPRLTISVTPTCVYSVVGSSTAIFGTAWNVNDTSTEMTFDPRDGLYKLTLENVQPEKNIDIKVVKNHDWGEAWGYYGKDNPRFSITAPCDVTVTYDPVWEEADVYGDHITYDWDIKAEYVIAVGSGSGTFLNGADWDPADESNKTTEVSDDVYEITYSGVAKGSYQFKFTANSVESANPWELNWGSEIEQNYPVNTEIEGVFNGKNCGFEVAEDNSTVTLRLDLSDYDYKTKQGAKMMCSVTPPEGNRYEDAFVNWTTSKFGEGWMNNYSYKYNELFTHYDGEQPDWVLCQAKYGDFTSPAITWLRIGGIGGRTVINPNWDNPFATGYGVYDVEANEFYALEDLTDDCFMPKYTGHSADKYEGLTDALAELNIGYATGDANKDNKIDILDAAFIQKYASGKAYMRYDEKYIADVNGDKVVDILDATAIQRYAVSA